MAGKPQLDAQGHHVCSEGHRKVWVSWSGGRWRCPECDRVRGRRSYHRRMDKRGRIVSGSEEHRRRVREGIARAMPTRTPKPMPEHGTTARYRRGCKCDECRNAQRLKQRRFHEQKAAREGREIQHRTGQALANIRSGGLKRRAS